MDTLDCGYKEQPRELLIIVLDIRNSPIHSTPVLIYLFIQYLVCCCLSECVKSPACIVDGMKLISVFLAFAILQLISSVSLAYFQQISETVHVSQTSAHTFAVSIFRKTTRTNKLMLK